MRKLFLLSLLTFSLAFPAASFASPREAPDSADEVVLTNSDRLRGKVVELDSETLRLEHEVAGTLQLPRAAIASLTTEEAVAVTLADSSVLVGRLRAQNDLLVLEGDDDPTTLCFDDLRSLRSPESQAELEALRDRLERPSLLDFWEGHFETGLSATRGNSHTATYTLGLEAARTSSTDKFITSVKTLYARDRTDGPAVTSANTTRGLMRYDRNFSPRLFSFGLTEVETNQLQDLDLRWVLGGGLGWDVVKSSRTGLKLLGGFTVNQEYFDLEPNRRTAEGLLGQELTYGLSRRVSLKQSLTVYPNLSERGEYRVNFDAAAITALNNWLAWTVNLSNRYITNPPEDRRRNDFLLTTGLRFTFRSGLQAPR